MALEARFPAHQFFCVFSLLPVRLSAFLLEAFQVCNMVFSF